METPVLSEKRIIREKVGKPLMWVSMVSMVMIFGGLTSAYAVRMQAGNWWHFDLPQMFYVSTVIILVSSVFMNWILAAAKKNNFLQMKIAAVITLSLGVTFIVVQFKAYGILVENNIVFAGSASNAAGSFLYILTGLHIVHLVAGILALLFVFVKILAGRYSADNLYGIRICAIFWHFLGALWIYLFLFLLFVR